MRANREDTQRRKRLAALLRDVERAARGDLGETLEDHQSQFTRLSIHVTKVTIHIAPMVDIYHIGHEENHHQYD